MKSFDIALKDMVRHFRSAFALVMMFVAPLLITGLIALAFSGLSGGGESSLPQTSVIVADLDVGEEGTAFRAGQVLIDSLTAEGMADYMTVTVVGDAEAALAAVDRREADVAVIIPHDLTMVALSHDARAAAPGGTRIEIVHDATLSLGPGLVKAVVDAFADALNGSRIATSVVAGQLAERGGAVDHETVEAAATRYAAWVQTQASGRGSGEYGAITLQPPPERGADAGLMGRIMGSVAAGMMLFFVFFTGASTAESIIREHEEGTLARLFTTPTPRAAILTGKLLAVAITLIVQLAVLLILTRALFGIRWGRPPVLAMAASGTIVAAAGFGVCVMSFVDNTRQSGPVMGGVLTISGMLGGLMTTGFQNLPAAYTTATLLTPHGWALRAWTLALEGAGSGELLLPGAVLLLYGGALFGLGLLRFRRRFA